jgi:hypothetical protein|tara:strand:- start:220 stop:480 length:261 start_codon:yes stop_codon:yes gene_type:complete
MSKSINIEGYIVSSTQVGVNVYKLSIFQNEIFVQNFTVSLQPNNSDEILPTFQLTDNKKVLPKSILDNLKVISDWIVETKKAHNKT